MCHRVSRRCRRPAFFILHHPYTAGSGLNTPGSGVWGRLPRLGVLGAASASSSVCLVYRLPRLSSASSSGGVGEHRRHGRGSGGPLGGPAGTKPPLSSSTHRQAGTATPRAGNRLCATRYRTPEPCAGPRTRAVKEKVNERSSARAAPSGDVISSCRGDVIRSRRRDVISSRRGDVITFSSRGA